jgi:hypothetical protein
LTAQGKDVWVLPVASRPNAEAAAQKITSSPAYDLYQCHFSPDRRWIVFEAVRYSPVESTPYVMAATGGPWIRITDGMHFDAVKGKPVGDPFEITSFESPSLMVPTNIPPVELSITQEKLVLTIAEVFGSIWILDHVGQ